MSDPRLPSDIDERSIDPVTCRRCELLQDKLDIQRDKVEQLQDVLSDALEFLFDLEMESRAHQFGPIGKQEYRTDLLSCIERVKKLA